MARDTSRPQIDDILESKVSMLGNNPLPMGYGAIESRDDAERIAYPDLKSERKVRIHIVWDCRVANLDSERVLDAMREQGAAMVTKVEAVS